METNKYQAPSLEIRRSEINLAGYNPRLIKPKARALLKANIKSGKLYGGITWNKNTGNLVSGHQRISVLDELLKYPENDYVVRVDVAELTEKEEKEQNIFLNNRNAQGEYDTQMLKSLINEIDYKQAGIDEIDLNMMGITLNVETQAAIDDISADFEELTKPAEDRKQAVKEAKAAVKAKAAEKVMQQDAFVMLSFDNYQAKANFMERFGFDADEKYIAGNDFSEMIERVEE